MSLLRLQSYMRRLGNSMENSRDTFLRVLTTSNYLLLAALSIAQFTTFVLLSLLVIWTNDRYGLAIPGLRELFLISLYPAFWRLTSCTSRSFAKNTLLFSAATGNSPLGAIFELAFLPLIAILISTISRAWACWPFNRALARAGCTKQRRRELRQFLRIVVSLSSLLSAIEERVQRRPAYELERDQFYGRLALTSQGIEEAEAYARYTNDLRSLHLDHLRPLIHLLTYLAHLDSRPSFLARFDSISQLPAIQELQAIPAIIREDLLSILSDEEFSLSFNNATSLSGTLSTLSHRYTAHLLSLLGILLQPSLLSSHSLLLLQPVISLAPPIALHIAEASIGRRNRPRHGAVRLSRSGNPFYWALQRARMVDWEGRAVERMENAVVEGCVELAFLRREERERMRAQVMQGGERLEML